MYKIVRMYSRTPAYGMGGHIKTKRHTIDTRLTLEQAQAHCQDPKTSGVKGGWKWFDTYTEQ